MITKAYFTEIEIVVNNSILSEENSNWKLPVNEGSISPVIFCNISAQIFGVVCCLISSAVITQITV